MVGLVMTGSLSRTTATSQHSTDAHAAFEYARCLAEMLQGLLGGAQKVDHSIEFNGHHAKGSRICTN